jgi:carboxypeptidase family protein
MQRWSAGALVSICLAVSACSGGGATVTPATPTPTPTPTPPTPAAATATISGRITDQQTGRGIVEALVRIVDGPNMNQAAVADANGNYTLPGLTPATFTLQVSAGGYATVVRDVDLRADAVLSIVLQASTRTIAGTVTDAATHGVLPNILVVVPEGPSAGISTRSDASGRYTIAGVSSSTTDIQASAIGYLTISRIVPIGGDARIDIVMTRTASVPAPPPPPAPTPGPTPPSGAIVITFASATGSVSDYREAGFSVAAALANWSDPPVRPAGAMGGPTISAP